MSGMAGVATREWFHRASRGLVLGVPSQYRYSGDDDILVIDRGEGTYVWDPERMRFTNTGTEATVEVGTTLTAFEESLSEAIG